VNWLCDNLLSADTAQHAVRIVLDYWRAGGWLMTPLAVICFLIWYCYLGLTQRLQTALETPEGCIDELEARLVRDRRDPAIAKWLAGLPGAAPRLARHLLARVAAGLSFHEAFEQCREGELSPYAHSFGFLAALVVAAPLLGLLGTVLGMIETFDAVALRSGETAELVAGGVSQALITTQVGLVAALPGAFGLAHVRRLYKRLRNDFDRCESHLYLLFERLDREPGPRERSETS